ncbi:MAG: D-alanyl-D-alanine carboxypeptidase/D-alanyl-D-alanine-endopeptidase [Ginsengibacter sp.]
MNKLFLLLLICNSSNAFSQKNYNALNEAFNKFKSDENFKHATISLYVIDNATGKSIKEENIQTGLAPASTQKIITAAAAYALLGKNFTYKTSLAYTGKIENGILNGNIFIKGSGDPTLGSWRYSRTTEEKIIAKFQKAIQQLGIKEITGHVIADESLFNDEVTPDGWIWQDIGSYYGAGATALIWRENQYDLFLKSGKSIGSEVSIADTKPEFVDGLNLKSLATSASKGSGDNAYIYHPLNTSFGNVRGTIPIDEKRFKISGAMPHPARQLAITLEAALKNSTPEKIAETYPIETENISPSKDFYSYSSPSLDSISYWFLNKSINLYGEALLKTLGSQLDKSGSTKSGLKVIKDFWKEQGFDSYSLNMTDGSGLSPGNRVTTSSLVNVLLYAKKQKWFASYYDGFPVINGIKMKSGSINGVLSYTGFIKSKSGEEYTFAFIVNNYDGKGNDTRRKMWKLLDVLK